MVRAYWGTSPKLPVDRNAKAARHRAEGQLGGCCGDVVHAVHKRHEDVVVRLALLARDLVGGETYMPRKRGDQERVISAIQRNAGGVPESLVQR